jgi:UPF0176 protein
VTTVATFYRFTAVGDRDALAAAMRAAATAGRLRGTALVATEGINATLAGTRAAIDAFIAWLRGDPRFATMRVRIAEAAPGAPVFGRLKVKVRDEIVALRQPDVDPVGRRGEVVDAGRWNALLDDPDVVIVDTRNRYEVALGTFPRALDPGTRSFRQFPAWAAARLDPSRDRQIAMFCTGGIRCEKASAYLLGRGFESVYQLDGGVLGYFDTATENRWRGACFVFDERGAVTW